MATDPKIERLSSTPLFSKAGKKELRELASAIDEVRIDADKTIIQQGVVHHEAFVVENGIADVYVDDQLVTHIPAGEMIGEIGLLTKGTATATVKSQTPMTLLVIPHQRFDQIMENTPGLGLAIARELANRLRATDERLH